jgi:hypothetical protein
VLSVGPLTLAAVAAARSWNVPAPSLAVGALTLSPVAAAAAWHVLAATFGLAVPLDWIVVGLFTDVSPRVTLTAVDPRVSLADASPTVALTNRAPTVALTPLEFTWANH